MPNLHTPLHKAVGIDHDTCTWPPPGAPGLAHASLQLGPPAIVPTINFQEYDSRPADQGVLPASLHESA